MPLLTLNQGCLAFGHVPLLADPDTAIFRFRGAHPRAASEFATLFGGDVLTLDTSRGIGFVNLFVPSGRIGWSIGWGVVAAWLFALVVLPSVARIRRRLPRKAWHVVHLLAVPAIALTAVHAVQAGSASMSQLFTRGLAVLVGICMYPIAIRLIGIAHARRAAA